MTELSTFKNKMQADGWIHLFDEDDKSDPIDGLDPDECYVKRSENREGTWQVSVLKNKKVLVSLNESSVGVPFQTYDDCITIANQIVKDLGSRN